MSVKLAFHVSTKLYYLLEYFFIVLPEILLNITELTNEERDLANFTCQAIGEPAPNISWYFNGTMINESDTSKYRIEPRPINTTTTEKTLTVYNVTSSDVGTYTCNAINTIGSDFSHGKTNALFNIKG